MPTDLMRAALRPLYQQARDAHPGLLIQRGLAAYDEGDSGAKTQHKHEHIERICAIPVGEFYRRAYARWQKATVDPLRFRSLVLALEARLFIGLTAGGMLETGCAIGHSHGAPYIPGSSIKGVVRAHVARTVFHDKHPEVCDELFGSEPGEANPLGLSGVVTFHDAWWVPDSAPRPLVQEVVTAHHPDYYRTEGQAGASDLDSPIPNAQIAVRGGFLFVLEGPLAWTNLAEKMLISAVGARGIGAKTRSGYGFLQPDEKENARLSKWQDEVRRENRERAQAALERQRRADEQARFEEQSELRKLIITAERELARFRALGEPEQRLQRAGFNSVLNALAEAAATWQDSGDVADAANLLERIYDTIGWADPGKNKKQRAKQERKRRDLIADLRGRGTR